MNPVPTQPLTGQDLLNHFQNLLHLPRREAAIHCGYVEFSGKGQPRAKLLEFYDAVLAARGITFHPQSGQPT